MATRKDTLHTLRSRQIEIPEIDAFLADYRKVCRKHRMMLEKVIDCDGDSYLTLCAWDSRSDLPLNLDEARDLPCITRALRRLDRQRKRAARMEKKAFADAVKKAAPGDPLALLQAALPHLDQLHGAKELMLQIAATLKTEKRRTR